MLKNKNNINSVNSINSINSINGGKVFTGKNNNNNNKNCSARMNVNNRGKNVGSNIAKNTNHNNNYQNNRNNSSNGGNGKIQKYAGSAEHRNRVQKINNLQAAMDAKEPPIQRWLLKSCNTSGVNCNETRVQHITDKQQRIKPATPARKRSSLARPVRVYDSFPQENGPVIVDWNETQNLRNQEIQQMQQPRQRQSQQKVKKKCREKEERKKKRERLEQAIDDLVEIRVDEEVTTWPIRLRLGDFFELSLPKCRRRKRRRRHRMMIATMREKTMKTMMEAGGIRAGRQQDTGAFRDTERLLKVLSINNVDQDNRYNVARCSVM